MKTKSFICLAFLSTLITFFAVSCSDENENPGDPDGTVTVNMLDEENGKTELGNSDVYIDKANNFYGRSCLLSSLGKKNGLGSVSIPILKGTTSKAAVEPGNAYQIFRNAAVREFPSGNIALNITADYYNVYVLSQIKQNDAVVGANVQFVLMDVPSNGLPEYNKNIGIVTPQYGYDSDWTELTITLPTSDFEYEPAFASSSFYTLEHEKKGNNLVVKLINYKKSDVFGFYIRIRDSYTYIYGEVKYISN